MIFFSVFMFISEQSSVEVVLLGIYKNCNTARLVERNSHQIQSPPYMEGIVLSLSRAKASSASSSSIVSTRIHFAEAISAIDIPARSRLKRHLCRLTTLRAGNIEHLPILPSTARVILKRHDSWENSKLLNSGLVAENLYYDSNLQF